MRKIKEQEFFEIIAELKGKTVIVKLEGNLQGKMLLENMDYEIPYKSNIITMHDKAKNNSIHINLSFYYKMTANEENNLLQVYCDNDILITIEVK